MGEETEWILCPVWKSKTRLKIRRDTVLQNFPLYCPKCKKESLIDVKKLEVKVIKRSIDLAMENLKKKLSNLQKLN